VIRDHPVFGVGLGRLKFVLHARNAASHAEHAHNLWLTWWAEAGTGALIAWIWLAALLLWRSLRGALTGDRAARAALVALLGFFAFSLTDHPAAVDRVALMFWIVAGVAAATGVPGRPAWRGLLRRPAASPAS
jgi:O-antigen ligase